jgi:hypothetical protein
VRLGWAIVGGIVLGGGLSWWLARDTPDEARRKHDLGAAARRADAEDARPVLYRWHDATGVLQVTAQPPRGAMPAASSSVSTCNRDLPRYAATANNPVARAGARQNGASPEVPPTPVAVPPPHQQEILPRPKSSATLLMPGRPDPAARRP